MKIRNKIILHLVYWFYMVNQLLFPFYISKTDQYFLADVSLSLVLNALTFYVVYFSIPLLIKNWKLVKTIIGGILIFSILVVFNYVAELIIWKYFIKLSKESISLDTLWFWIIRMTIVPTIYAILIKFAIDWFDAQKMKAELQNQKQVSELALLRSQVNPHFFFNTLNNIYSLVYKKSEDAPAAVMKLSSIMRYMLYDANTDSVLLEKEVEYLQSFIELHKLRLKQQDFVAVTITGDLNGKTITPMLLIPFVENAFKHCNKNVSAPGILIDLIAEPARILFSVFNYRKNKVDASSEIVGGIGLNNIRRRLELLYPGKHSLEIIQEEESYNVKLIIEN
ncbi:MAG: histidine kinase [Bacteroidetes bacterium]|nr:histidine kinase [Bacteroidota bacterium]